MTNFLNQIKENITTPKRIIFPESNTESIIIAAHAAYQDEICNPFFIDNNDNSISTICQNLGFNNDWYTLLSPSNELANLIENDQIRNSGIPEEALLFLLEEPLYFATACLKVNKVDAMIAGYTYTTGEVVSAGLMFLKGEDKEALISSFFIMDIPGFEGSEKNLLVLADCGVNIDPTAKELSIIAKDTAQSVQQLLDWEPRIAFLSSSTKGSIEHERVDKVQEAFRIFKESYPRIKSEGEIQADVALDRNISTKKIQGETQVGGEANILIFPDLDSGNIAYKLISKLARATSYGPILQGLDKPLFDLSRGSSVEEIIGVITIASILSDNGAVK